MAVLSLLKERIRRRMVPAQPQNATVNELLAFGETGTGQTVGSNRMTNYKAYLECVKIANVNKALSVISYSYAAAPLEVVTDDVDEDPVDLETEAPDLAALFKQPNPLQDGFAFFEQQSQDQQLTGNHIVAMDDLDGFGRPHQLYRMRPDQVRIIVNGGSLRYAYGNGMGWGGQTYEQDEILHWKWSNPLDPLWGLGVIEAGEAVFSRDKLINEYIRAYFERGAVILGAITLPGRLASEDDYNRLMRRWRGMVEAGRATFKTGVLEDGADYKTIQEPLGNIPFVAIAQMSRNDVFQLFGVPPQKAGDFAGSNYRNAEQADAFFAAETMDPLWTRAERGWTPLVKRWNDGWKAKFKRPTVPVDIESRAHAAQMMSLANSYRRNDIVAVTGHEPYPPNDPRGEEIVSTAKANLDTPDPTPELGPGSIPIAETPMAVANDEGVQDS